MLLAGSCGSGDAWPSIGDEARQLAPVGNKPVLFHNLEALAGAGVRDVVVVTDASTSGSIGDAVRTSGPWDLDVHHVERDRADDLIDTLRSVGAPLDRAPALVAHADVVLRGGLDGLAQDFAGAGDVDMLLWRLPAHRRGVAPSTAAGGPAGACVIGPRALRDIERGEGAAGLRGALARLRGRGRCVRVDHVAGCLSCHGSQHELLAAQRTVFEHLPASWSDASLSGSEIQGCALIHPTARLDRTLVRGPAVVGPGARLSHCYVGPYTSIGADVVLEDVEIEDSIVMTGAEIRHLSSRVEMSVVGRSARLTRDFRVPRTLRLSVGQGAEVMFA